MTAVITIGRMNPATSAHSLVIETVAKVARKNNGDGFVYLTKSQDPKKNPLTYTQKLKWARKSNPRYADMIVDSSAKNPFEVFTEVYNKGYDELIIVVGADRVGEFEAMATKYNGEKARHGYYKFENIEVVSAGSRDPDAEGMRGMSASKLRKLASEGNFEEFSKGVSQALTDKEKEQFYQDVRKGMRITENIMRFREYLNEVTLQEEITQSDLDQIEKYADKLFSKVGIDVEFTKHFLQRVNDKRNKKPITSAELIRIFRETYKKYGKILPTLGDDAQAVLRDMKTNINVPFVLNVDKDGMLDLVNKTVMRKKGFKTSNPVYSFEDFRNSLQNIAENIINDK